MPGLGNLWLSNVWLSNVWLNKTVAGQEYRQRKIIVFCKAPVPGMVKTRLACGIGEQAAAEIHRLLARHCLQVAVSSRLAPVELWCSPSCDDDFFRQCAQDFSLVLKSQTGGDLGSRMSHAFAETLPATGQVLLIGTDCPVMDAAVLAEAFSSLSNGNQTVVVPAEDGGYALIGMKNHQPELFENINWGTNRVLNQTLKSVHGKYARLATLWDVDHPADLQRLMMEEIAMDDEFRDFLRRLVSH